MEEVGPKMRGSDAGQSRRRRVRSCRGCPQALHEEFSFLVPRESVRARLQSLEAKGVWGILMIFNENNAFI